ncbi:DUF58 domain-containing protein [Corynebacterium sp. 335C]
MPGDPDRDLHRVLRHLELTVTRRLDGLLRGSFASAARGPGTDPDAAREYVPGDDVRRMDWAVTARTGAPHVRDPEAERELECWILADAPPRLAAGTVDTTKRHLLVAVCAAVALLNDGPGTRTALLADGSVVPPGSGRVAALRLAAAAARHSGGSGLAADLGTLPARAPRCGLAVVVSDFLGPVDWARELRAVGARCDVLAVRLVDPADVALPGEGPAVLADPGTGRLLEVTVDDRTRARYAAEAARHAAEVDDALRAARARVVTLRTDRDWVADLARQLSPARTGAA